MNSIYPHMHTFFISMSNIIQIADVCMKKMEEEKKEAENDMKKDAEKPECPAGWTKYEVKTIETIEGAKLNKLKRPLRCGPLHPPGWSDVGTDVGWRKEVLEKVGYREAPASK